MIDMRKMENMSQEEIISYIKGELKMEDAKDHELLQILKQAKEGDEHNRV